ncbi:hypothetical protein NM208_g6582 [Fusarium decemcellulare]|uniref:Uncharacterized protein n=1 Tax=Fusarium decemcellulare TaxID=57161 RepID=A0ACC1SCK1_9HYPO|nr:hypothetical protein NM208_g6582 [Fusarium decemcellulare]
MEATVVGSGDDNADSSVASGRIDSDAASDDNKDVDFDDMDVVDSDINAGEVIEAAESDVDSNAGFVVVADVTSDDRDNDVDSDNVFENGVDINATFSSDVIDNVDPDEVEPNAVVDTVDNKDSDVVEIDVVVRNDVDSEIDEGVSDDVDGVDDSKVAISYRSLDAGPSVPSSK